MLKGSTCSPEQKRKIGLANTGRYLKDKSPVWKGGRKLNKQGYIVILTDERGGCRNRNKYRLEHRVVMEKHLGRPLEKYEAVHHKNGIKTDNRLINLELLIRWQHRGKVICPHCQKEFCVP